MVARSGTPILISFKKNWKKVQNRAARFVTRNYFYETHSACQESIFDQRRSDIANSGDKDMAEENGECLSSKIAEIN